MPMAVASFADNAALAFLTRNLVLGEQNGKACLCRDKCRYNSYACFRLILG